jgi:hypothetical protein
MSRRLECRTVLMYDTIILKYYGTVGRTVKVKAIATTGVGAPPCLEIL